MQMIAGMIGFCAYIPLIAGIVRNTVQQSFTAFLLWAILDIIATITTFLQDGNYWLPFSNVVGATTVTILLGIKKQVSWSWVETMTAILVVICLVVWSVSGETAGIVASSLAVVVASIPQMVETYQKPTTTPLFAYLIFLSANILSFASGRSWTIEERFYAGCSVFLCVVIVSFAARRWRRA
jgi:hypothetical protein